MKVIRIISVTLMTSSPRGSSTKQQLSTFPSISQMHRAELLYIPIMTTRKTPRSVSSSRPPYPARKTATCRLLRALGQLQRSEVNWSRSSKQRSCSISSHHSSFQRSKRSSTIIKSQQIRRIVTLTGLWKGAWTRLTKWTSSSLKVATWGTHQPNLAITSTRISPARTQLPLTHSQHP